VGAKYRIRSVYPTPTAQELRATPFGMESGFPGETQLPAGPEIDEIRHLAEEWTVGKENGFDKVMAIQQRLHAFHYDKTAQYQDSLQGLVEFLKVRQEGFCVHFAYAMGVMLRTLGIPARVATGFTPGQGGDRRRHVQRDDERSPRLGRGAVRGIWMAPVRADPLRHGEPGDDQLHILERPEIVPRSGMRRTKERRRKRSAKWTRAERDGRVQRRGSAHDL
jgi:transglutaminase-like putative cysteine protease